MLAESQLWSTIKHNIIYSGVIFDLQNGVVLVSKEEQDRAVKSSLNKCIDFSRNTPLPVNKTTNGKFP